MIFHLIASFLGFIFIWLSCGKNAGGHRVISKQRKSDKKVVDKTILTDKGPKGSKKKPGAKKRQEDEISSPATSCSKSSKKVQQKKKGGRPLGLAKKKTDRTSPKPESKPKSKPKTPKPLDNNNLNKKTHTNADEYRDLPPIKKGPSFDSLVRNIEKQRGKPKEDDESTDLRTPSWLMKAPNKAKLDKNPTGRVVNELQKPENPLKSPKTPKVETEMKPANEPEGKKSRETSIKEYTAKSYKDSPKSAVADKGNASTYFPVESKAKDIGN